VLIPVLYYALRWKHPVPDDEDADTGAEAV
jgi:hypothetical protein